MTNQQTKADTVLKTPATVKVSETETRSLASAVVPASTKVDAGADKLTLVVTNAAHPEGFTVADNEKAKTYDVKIVGVAADNTVEIPVELYVGKGLCEVQLYHNGSLMSNYTYDSATGFISFKTATFSPFTVVSKIPSVTVDGVAYESVKAAIEAAPDGATIAFAKDYTASEAISIMGKNITLDINGKNVDTQKFDIKNSTVTIKDSGNGELRTNDSYSVIAAVNSNITIESGRFVSTYSKSGSSGYANVIQVSNSNLTINGGYFENTDAVGSYNYLIKVSSYNRNEITSVTINGGEFVSHRNYGYIVTGDSDANVEVTINDGTFKTDGGNSYLTNVKGSVVVNNCKFTAEGSNSVFSIPAGSTVTVKGGTYSVNEKSYTDTSLAGLIFHRKTNGWTSVGGTLIVDPTSEVKVNQPTYSGFFAAGAKESAKGADGYYTISK